MNAKINKVVDVIITVCNVLNIIAQAVKSAFPVKKNDVVITDLSDVDKDNAAVIAQFLAQERVK